MNALLSWKEIKAQSDAVYNQFGKRWQEFARKNAKLPRKDSRELRNIGIGKHMVMCGMGESLEAKIDIIKKYRDKVDVFCCDKAFKPLLEHGVRADYVMICDTNILTKWIDGVIEETKGVKLLATPYANTEWTHIWKGDIYFFINKDAIETEKIFQKIFNYDEGVRIIPAGSNVSNAMIIFANGSDQDITDNYMGYEKYILIGYDYSWRPEGNYYAWGDPKPKRYYMNHRTILDIANDPVFTSENLLFSAKWLYSYVTTFKLPVVNCSDRGILDLPYKNNLKYELKAINTANIENCRNLFDMLKDSYRAFQKNKKLYEQSRMKLIHQGGLSR